MTTEFAGSQYIIEIIYLIASVLFILSLKWMSAPKTARHGVWAGEIGMVLAIAGTLLHHGIVDYKWIVIALVIGSGIGIPLGLVQMTAVPQRTALSHAFGAFCVTLVGTAEFYLRAPNVPPFMMAVICMEVILGSLTFTGSLMAAGKLQEVLPQRPITYKGQNIVNLGLLAIAIAAGIYPCPPSGCQTTVSRHGGHSAVLRRLHDHAHRRSRHAHGDLAAELLRRTFRGRHGFRGGEQASDHRRRAGRLLGIHSLGHHVQGDEPVIYQRHVWGVWTGASFGGSGQGREDGSQRHRRGSCGHSGGGEHRWSSFPVTAWRSRRRSTRFANSTMP